MLIETFNVFAGVGERTREENDLYQEMIKTSVMLKDKTFKVMHEERFFTSNSVKK